ncbi:GWxTD domain-containing protein [bacterium]|nr:GWxTD domain-containing protein [bacterium]
MTKKTKWMGAVSVLAGLLLSISGLYAQLPERTAYDDTGPLPWFFTTTASRLGADSVTIELHVGAQIAYDRLQFVKNDSLYEARYELSVSVFNAKQVQTGVRTIRKKVSTKTYTKTTSNFQFDTTWLVFTVEPGDYTVEISVLDIDLAKTAYRTVNIRVPDYFKGPFSLSSLRFRVPGAVSGSGDDRFAVSSILEKEEKQHELEFEVYAYQQQESLDLVYRIVDAADKTVFENEETVPLTGFRTVRTFLMDSESMNGQYKFIVESGRRRNKVERVRSFTLHYRGMPALSTSLDDAIDQLSYIAAAEEIRVFKDVSTDERKKQFFEFWADRDPTPTTPANELMEEYYRRVDFANRVFGKFTAGWKTDRGRVYIILGAPDAVDRHPFEPDSKPYEIWYYRSINREFIFVDDQGFGEYYLTTPHYDVLQGRY